MILKEPKFFEIGKFIKDVKKALKTKGRLNRLRLPVPALCSVCLRRPPCWLKDCPDCALSSRSGFDLYTRRDVFEPGTRGTVEGQGSARRDGIASGDP